VWFSSYEKALNGAATLAANGRQEPWACHHCKLADGIISLSAALGLLG